MSSRTLILLFAFSTQMVFSQTLLVEAIYYDKQDKPYKIDQKYSGKETIIYVTHDNESSICLKKQTSLNGDTTIISETYYNIVREKTKLEKLLDCDSWGISINDSDDKAIFTGYRSFLLDTMVLIGDTVLTGDAVKNSWDFYERIKYARVPAILANEITVKLDSLAPLETTVSYFLNDIPYKAEVFYPKDGKHSTTKCKLSANKMIWKRYFIEDRNKPYKIDRISWNSDTTEIIWHSIRDDIGWNEVAKYHINGTQLKIDFSGNRKKEIEYLDSKNIFTNMLTADFIYPEYLYYMELRYFDREKIISSTEKEQVSKNRFSYDKQNRIIEQRSYNNEILYKRVTYTYERE